MLRVIFSASYYLLWTLLLPEFIKNIIINIYFRAFFGASKNLLGTCNVELYDLLRQKIILGSHSFIGKEVILRGNISIGKYTYLTDYGQFHSSDTSPITIGSFCSIAPNCFLISYSLHSSDRLTTSTSLGGDIEYPDKGGPISIGHDVWIGANVTILPGVTIGNGAIIGAGSIVTKSIPPYAVAVGNPARVIRYRFDQEVIEQLEGERWWEKSIEEVRERYKQFSN